MSMSRRLRMALILAITMGGGGFVAIWAVIWLGRGSYLSAIIALGAAVLLFCLAFQTAYAVSATAQIRAECGPQGTKIWPPKWADLIFRIDFTVGVFAAALYLTFAPFGMVDYVPSSVLRVTLPAGCIFYVIFGTPVVFRMFRYRAGSHLRLDPSGFEVWNGQWGAFTRGTWNEVEQVLDHPVRGSKPFQEVIVLALPKGRSAMLIAGAMTGNSRALREWVRFYWQHPEHRAELTDARGLQRLEQEKFTAE